MKKITDEESYTRRRDFLLEIMKKQTDSWLKTDLAKEQKEKMSQSKESKKRRRYED